MLKIRKPTHIGIMWIVMLLLTFLGYGGVYILFA